MKSLNNIINMIIIINIFNISSISSAKEVKDGVQQLDNHCESYLGEISCGSNKNIYKITRDGEQFQITLYFNGTTVSNPFLCNDNKLVRDTNDPTFKEMISFLDNLQKDKLLKNPGYYQIKKKGEIYYESYDPYKKITIKQNCTHKK